jgi:regulator of sigma E protease
MGIFFFILGIILFIALVLVHEWGHFIMARRNGVEVEEFGLGFPPQAKVLTKKKGTIYTLNWLPLGGFVKLKGEHDIDEEKGSFGAASTWAKTKIMVAGVFMNLVTAFVLLTIVALIGMPKLLDNQYTVARDTKIVKDIENKGVVRIADTENDSPAAKAGIAKDDRVVSLNGTVIDTTQKLSDTAKENAGKEVKAIIQKAGSTDTVETQVTLNSSLPYLGVSSYSDQKGLEIRRSTWSAPIVAIGVSKDFTVATLKGLGSALKGLGSIVAGAVTGNTQARQVGQSKASTQVSGPVGVFQLMYSVSQESFGLMLFIVAVISLTLAIMNVLPIPALDGGRLFVMLFFRLIRKPLKPKLEEAIHGTGFVVLMLLFLLITIVDIRRIM